MFGYFGSKHNFIHHYPSPECEKIVEPFAGSARYSLRYWQYDVWINDVYPVVYEIWKYLQQASYEDIRSLPVLKRGEDIRNITTLSDVERNLLGFCVGIGRSNPGNVVTEWAGMQNRIGQTKRTILRNLDHIKHWKITNLDYKEIPSIKATWFVDPPYQIGGECYVHNKIDYIELGDWCEKREGQLIVCENRSADWMPFKPLVLTKGSTNEHIVESMYHRSHWFNKKKC